MSLFRHKWTEKDFLRWEVERERGPVHWILRNGIMGWGTSMFLMMTAFSLWFHGKETLSREELTRTMGIWLVGGLLWGLAMWLVCERSYRKEIGSKDAV